MTQGEALAAFAALAQDTRLRIVRALVQAGPDGLAAGVLGEKVGATSSRLSFHLKDLQEAGLVSSRRESRCVVYRPCLGTLAALVGYLAQDCCDGHPEVCAALSPAPLTCCPEPANG